MPATAMMSNGSINSPSSIRSLAILVAALPGFCGCSIDPPPVAARQDSIIGGTRDTGDPAVMLLIAYPQDLSTFYTCTSVLISPVVLLTAAHCVDAANHPIYLFGVFLGDDASAYGSASQIAPQLVPAKEVHVHPLYSSPTAPFYADIAVVLLSQPLGVSPLPWNRTALTSALVGQPARIIGYGQTIYGQYNAMKFAANTTVKSLGAVDTVAVGDNTHHSCLGDSGGPALIQMNGIWTVVGVDSYSDQAGCLAAANYRRTDSFASFIDSYLPVIPPPDMSELPDLSVLPDLVVPPDLRVQSDLNVPIDLARPADLAKGACPSNRSSPMLSSNTRVRTQRRWRGRCRRHASAPPLRFQAIRPRRNWTCFAKS